MNYVPYMLICVVVIIVLIFIYARHQPRHKVGAGLREWHVANYPNSQDAAMLLSEANTRMISLLRVLKAKYHINETREVTASEGPAHNAIVNAPNDTYKMAEYLLDNYNPDVFYENDPKYTSDTSYTTDKGRSMHICLRDKVNPAQLVNINTLMFVMLHECAHIANYRHYGHSNMFWIVFKWLLHEATSAGVYDHVDYARFPAMYCGLTISYQPLDDQQLPEIWAHKNKH